MAKAEEGAFDSDSPTTVYTLMVLAFIPERVLLIDDPVLFD
jgi:hypothetical protein